MKNILYIIGLFITTMAYGQGPYYVRVLDKVQFFQHPDLEIKANAASSITPVKTGAIPFKIHSYDLYPVLGAAKADFGLDKEKEWAIGDLEAKDYYLGIIKEYVNEGVENGPAEWMPKFTIKIKLPISVAGFEQVDEMEKVALQNKVQKAVEEEYKKYAGFKIDEAVARSEIAGLEIFKSTLVFLKNGGVLVDLFKDSGFDELETEGPFQVITKNNVYENADGIDYAGLKTNDDNVKLIDQYGDAQQQSYTEIGKPYLIITASSSQSALNDYSLAATRFNTNPRKIICWIHFQTQEDGSIKLYRNVKCNLSKSEAENYFNLMVDMQFENYQQSYEKALAEMELNTISGREVISNRSDCIPGQYDCTLPSFSGDLLNAKGRDAFVKSVGKYNMYCCNVKPFVADDFYNEHSTSLEFLYPYYYSTYHEEISGKLGYDFGLVNGVGEGIKEILVLAYNIGYKFLRAVPGNPTWVYDVMEKSVQHGIAKGAGTKLADDFSYFKELASEIYEVLTNIPSIFSQIKTSLSEGAQDAVFQNGAKAAGYVHGYVIFAVALDIITLGSSTLVTAGTKVATTATKVISATGKIAKTTFRTAAKGMGQTLARFRGLGGVKGIIREFGEDVRKLIMRTGRTLNQMRGSLEEWVALQRQLATSNSQLREFNTATILFDKNTGKYYYGANKGIALSGSEIHPTLAKKLPETTTNAYKLGNCAECHAVNQALHDGSKWGDLQMHTLGVDWKTGATFPKAMCSNCEITFKGIEILK